MTITPERFDDATRFAARPLLAVLALPVLMALAIWAYWPALAGPFLFDDFNNVNALALIDNDASWSSIKTYLLSGQSGVLGRPLSLLSFLLNDIGWPSDPRSFKYTNLMIHLLNGLILGWIVLRVQAVAGRRDSLIPALFVVGFWILSPYHVSTVMYVVQRMALLSTLFVLLGLGLYVVGRQATVRGQHKSGMAWIGSGFAVACVLGGFSKENAALFVLLVPVLEWTVFRNQPRSPLLLVTLIAPAVIFVAGMAVQWPGYAAVYELRDFSLGERLLTQARVVGYYLWRYLMPGISYAGLFSDDFTKSASLLQPMSTVIWMVVHPAILFVAVRIRKSLPLVTFAIVMFYTGHLLESSLIPLELFFEHRNYLPSAFLLVGLLHLRWRPVVGVVMATILLASTGLLRLQSGFWANNVSLTSVWYQENPRSHRALLHYSLAMDAAGNLAESLRAMLEFAEREPPGAEVAANIALVQCHLRRDTQADVERLLDSVDDYRVRTHWIVDAVQGLSRQVVSRQCQRLSLADLERFLDQVLTVWNWSAADQQELYLAKARVALMGGDIRRFKTLAMNGLDLLDSAEQAVGVCQQIHRLGDAEAACQCRDRYQHLTDPNAPYERTILQRLVGHERRMPLQPWGELDRLCPTGDTMDLPSER